METGKNEVLLSPLELDSSKTIKSLWVLGDNIVYKEYKKSKVYFF